MIEALAKLWYNGVAVSYDDLLGMPEDIFTGVIERIVELSDEKK